MGRLENKVSYSDSKANLLDECSLQYYRSVYQSWEGWYKNAPKDKREAYIAKKSHNIYTYGGHVVHGIAERLAKKAMATGPMTVDRDKFRDFGVKLAMDQVEQALKDCHEEKWRDDPKNHPVFIEMLLDEPFKHDILIDRTLTATKNLFSEDSDWDCGSNLFIRAVESGKILSAETLERTEILGVNVFLAKDVVIEGTDGKPVVMDYKTGNYKDSHLSQAELYGVQEDGADKVVLAYLKEKPVKTSVVKIDQKKSKLKVNARVMKYKNKLKNHLVDGDLDRNEPIRDSFVATTDSSNCRFCPYRGMCKKDGVLP